MKVHTFQGNSARHVRTAVMSLEAAGGEMKLRDLQAAIIEKYDLPVEDAVKVTRVLKTDGLIENTKDGRSYTTRLTEAGEQFHLWLLQNSPYGTSIKGAIDIPQDNKHLGEHAHGVVLETRIPIGDYRRLSRMFTPAFVPKGAEVFIRMNPDSEFIELPRT